MVTQDLSRVTPVELVVQIGAILREVSLVGLRMARSPMQVLVASLVASGDRHAGVAELTWEHVGVEVASSAHVSHTWAATAANYSLTLVVVTAVMVLAIIMANHILILQLGEKTAPVQVERNGELVELWQQLLLATTILVSSVASNRV